MPTNKPPDKSKKVPASALRFAADVAIGDALGDSKKVPVSLTARTKDAVDHWYWGRIVHDMAGFKVAKPTIPIDYCHNDSDILGYADKFDVVNGDLVAGGALTPFAADDRASEVIFKQQQGVPYQASVYFDPHAMVLESVPEGMAVEVNGYKFEGPGVVARQWTLRGIAICPHGQDSNTNVEFASDKGREVSVTFTEGTEMPVEPAKTEETTTTPEPPAPVTEAKPGEEKPAEKKPELTEGAIAETPATDAPAHTPAPPPAPPTELSQGQKFLTAFGNQGGVWFAQGKSFEEAQGLFNQSMKAENDALKAKVTELQTKLSASRGEKTPVSFQAASEDGKTDGPPVPTTAQEAALGAGLAKFAAAIKIS